ncbi:semaphorin-4A [Strongylocentrotus purpuratus]|uniref:Sema domain-containing protein n=1 Tax=Strongylocentrotus purpuratus TaxID=7668 RepID=A0A7M7PBS4_STRPU|nr:semaphorin-4A [Strongylocentrotus purpuratus]
MLKGQILAVFLYTACLTSLSEQAILTCDGGDEIIKGDVRVVDGYQRSGAADLIFLGSDQNLTIIDGNIVNTGYLGVCYSTGSTGCYKTHSDVEDCDNYIRGVTTLGQTCNSSSCRVLACGTNAELPRCAFCGYDGSMLNCSFIENDPPQDLPYDDTTNYSGCTSDNIDGGEVFQYRKNDNATFLYHVNRIYYGLTIESDVPKSIVGLASVTPDGLITGKVITRTDSEKMVADEAQFVGTPFVSGEFVYFLFRESAQEFASLSAGQGISVNTYYSRIARICKNDDGVTVSSTMTLTSFLKQRLVCSQSYSDGSSLDYNEIQDFALSDDGTMIHAVFTSGQNEAPQTALCVFDLTSINETFNEGDFFGADGAVTNDLWRVYDGDEVSPRPGLNCSDPNTAETDFERDYNLMSDHAVGTLQFFLLGDRFSDLEMTSKNGKEIYIISSEKGCLYEVEVDTTEPDLGDPCHNPVVSRPIKDLELAPDNSYLVTTLDNVDLLSDCTVYQAPQEPSVSPPGGTYRVPPNSTFDIIYDTLVNGLPCIMSNGEDINECNIDTAYRLLKKDCNGNLVHMSILILDNTTVTFNESNLNYTIQPYDHYSENELGLRCGQWEEGKLNNYA